MKEDRTKRLQYKNVMRNMGNMHFKHITSSLHIGLLSMITPSRAVTQHFEEQKPKILQQKCVRFYKAGK